jgi:hypothetical protein
MKKALKIIGITFASLLGLVLVVAGIAMAMISSSGRLTQMVKKHAPEFITCEMQLGKAELTLFKAFPNVGVDIKDVALINPMESSPSDTLANINNLIVVVDIQKLLKEKVIVVRRCILEEAFVNLYSDSLGNNNFNVFHAMDNDTLSTFDYWVDIEEVKLKNSTLLYADDRIGMKTFGKGLNLDLKGRMKDKNIDVDLALVSDDLSLKTSTLQLAVKDLDLGFNGNIIDLDQISGTLELVSPNADLCMDKPYLENDTLNLNLPLQLNLSEKKLHLDESRIGVNRYLVNLNGDAKKASDRDFNFDLALKTNAFLVESVLKYLPERWQRQLGDIEYSGKLSITEAAVKGTYNDSLMPLISAIAKTDNAKVYVPSLPYPFTEVKLDADLYLDLNTDANSLTFHSVKAKFNRCNLAVNGVVDDMLGDMGLKLNIKGDGPMKDLESFIPQKVKLDGRASLNLTTNFTYEQLKKSLDDYDVNRLPAKANLSVKDFSFDMDTLHVMAPTLNAHLVLPASVKGPTSKGAYVVLNSIQLDANMGDALNAKMKDADIVFSADNFKNGVEQLLLDVSVNCNRLELVYDTIDVGIDTPAITFVTTPEKDAKGLKAHVAIDGQNLTAGMGKDYALNTNLLKIKTSMVYKEGKVGFLSQWNPDADVVLGNAKVKVARLDEDIRISNIDFQINTSEIDFKKSTFRIGDSDLSLQGRLLGFKEWVEEHKNNLKGEFQVASNMLNLNEILELTRDLSVSSELETESDENTNDDPFMVPEGVDFSFVLKAKKALYDNFDLNDLSGEMIVKDGTLILQEIGFTNKAAEMQLTAMYQSPRKNNLLLAMDFHLLDVQINDLLHMIPYIDTLVPMLKTFDGQAEIHIGAETNLKANYEPKISTLRASADIEGKNLSVNDKFTFTKITDMLDISTNGNYSVDSLDLQLTAFKNEIDLWPSQVAIGKYKVTVDGRMTLDKNGEYHLSVTESPMPTRFGLIVSGPLNDLDYKFEKSKFPTLYKPNKRSDTEQMYIDLKKKIADRLKENVRH